MPIARKFTNAGGMRRYDERLILSRIRRVNGAVALAPLSVHAFNEMGMVDA